MRYKIMADVLIRNIDKNTLNRLKERAKRNKRSLQAELKNALEEYAVPTHEEVIAKVREIRESFEKKGIIFPDSTEEIRKSRDSI